MQALKALGKERVDAAVIQTLRHQLEPVAPPFAIIWHTHDAGKSIPMVLSATGI